MCAMVYCLLHSNDELRSDSNRRHTFSGKCRVRFYAMYGDARQTIALARDAGAQGRWLAHNGRLNAQTSRRKQPLHASASDFFICGENQGNIRPHFICPHLLQRRKKACKRTLYIASAASVRTAVDDAEV